MSVHTAVDMCTYNNQWKMPSCDGGLSLLGYLSQGGNAAVTVLLWTEQDILKK